MNEKQRRARRRAAAREWKKESRGLLPFQRVLLREMNRAYRKPLQPWLPLTGFRPGRATLIQRFSPGMVIIDEVGPLPKEEQPLTWSVDQARKLMGVADPDLACTAESMSGGLCQPTKKGPTDGNRQ